MQDEFYPDYELDARNAAAAARASPTAAALQSRDDNAYQVSTQQAAASLASAVLSDALTPPHSQAGAQAAVLQAAPNALYGTRRQWQDAVQMAQLAVTLDRQKGLLLHLNPAVVSLLRSIKPDLAARAAHSALEAQQGGYNPQGRDLTPRLIHPEGIWDHPHTC